MKTKHIKVRQLINVIPGLLMLLTSLVGATGRAGNVEQRISNAEHHIHKETKQRTGNKAEQHVSRAPQYISNTKISDQQQQHISNTKQHITRG